MATHKFSKKIMELGMRLGENMDPSRATQTKIFTLIALIKLVDQTAIIHSLSNRLLPPITTGRDLPIIYTKLRDYFKFTSLAYQFNKAGKSRIFGSFYMSPNIEPNIISEDIAVDCMESEQREKVNQTSP